MTAPTVADLPLFPPLGDPNYATEAQASASAMTAMVEQINAFGAYLNSNTIIALEFGDGVVGAPSIHPASDPNTGFYFPAADTIAAAIGGVNKLTVTASGVAVAGTVEGTNVSATGATSNRNMIVNGENLVSQRRVSLTSVSTSGYWVVDRFKTALNAGGTWTISQEDDGPAGFNKSFKYLCTTVGSTSDTAKVAQHVQVIEGINTQRLDYGSAGAQSSTMSFWVKSNVTGTYTCRMTVDGASRLISKNYTISVANAWEYKTITFAGDETTAIAGGNGVGLNIAWWLTAGTDFTSGAASDVWQNYASANEAPGQVDLAAATGNYWQITGVQLVLGETDTPFEHKFIGDLMAQCQRYYYDLDYTITYEQIKAPCWINGTATMQGEFIHPVTMRIGPTVGNNGAGNFRLNDNSGGDQVCSNIGVQSSNVNVTTLNFTKPTANLSIGKCGYINTEAANDAKLTFDSEL